MKILINIAFLFVLPFCAHAQLNNLDSLLTALHKAPDGRERYKAVGDIYFFYQELNRDSALLYAEEQEAIAKRMHNNIGEGVALANKSYQFMGLGKYADALLCLQQAFAIAEDVKTETQEAWDYFITPFHGNSRLLLLSYTHHMYGLLMLITENPEQQIVHFRKAAELAKEIKYMPRILLAYMNLGQSYLTAKQLDSALYYEKETERWAMQATLTTYAGARAYIGSVQLILGDIYKELKNDSLSLSYYYKSLQSNTGNINRISLSRVYLRLSRYYREKANKDSALYYSRMNLAILQTIGQVTGPQTNLGIGYENLYRAYMMNHQFDSAFKYQGLALVTKDSLANVKIKNLAEFQKRTYLEQLRLKTLEKEKVIYQNKVRTYFLLGGIGVLLLLAVIIYLNNRQKNKAKIKIEQAYDNLKATQMQLIQAEKMASLGELTAGIAHEIQNPLNFVNNFSEVNREIADEATVEISKGNYDEVRSMLNDIKDNSAKIHHHGSRADAIVKGMLQHSQKSSGLKELTDINALTDEYVRLAYHGLRAKNKSFHATIKTDFDNSVGSIYIIPQDIGRVILNLLNNAFYAASLPSPENIGSSGKTESPAVWVSTKKNGDKVCISVRDNGPGIPQNIINKIFQPFFTTKPTGQGTGLGLSLSYDIVKAHGGEINVVSKDGEGTTFIVQLIV